ncbi:selenocysteine-specific translation elongation factor [Fusobacterium mortiferum]|uniref:Selenocysteine-specific elongation factor n=1 Tax=Fusobacterium mortiferum TaxID=850 RepID=A0ABS2G354_FUSMR|nr:selenocysteine-specific translation elongation factor [Fusobacterium mortiferum]MBM6875104.1 selenocysteine-specific translation elongation factor [Fusobacterium mortiferum]
MRDIIVGMAGHIDHGKTTVVKYLTGVDTDTLPEEKTRGMTIDLGFTQIKFEDNSRVGLIDVPGHEKFIKNMSAGASGVDYLILVVACDDGIMPQTIEHFQIVKLFGVTRGMILLTKRDLVDEKRYEEVKKECQEYFKESFLEKAPILEVSSKEIESYKRVKALLYRELKELKIEDEKKYFRMDIDRVFTLKGFGCIVTGTVKNGEVKVGDNLTIYPKRREVRVKSIESHGEKKESLGSGNRCAINLSGVESSELERGDIIARNLLVGDRVDCKLSLLESVPKIKNNQRIRLNIGTTEVIGRVKIYEKNYILGGEEAVVQLQLENTIGGILGERGIVRNYSPITTIGGVELLFFPKSDFNRRYLQHIDFLNTLSKNSDRVEELFKKDMSLDEISALIGKNIELESYISFGKIYLLDKKIIQHEILDEKLKLIENYLIEFHQKNSLKKGVTKSTLRSLLLKELSQKEFNILLDLDKVKESIKVVDDYISLKDFKIRLTREEKDMKEEIFSYYKNQKFEINSYSYYFNQSKNKYLFEKVHAYMVEEGFIQYLEDEYFILSGFLKESIKLINEYFQKNITLEIKDTRALLNNSRDSAILILRKLDTLKITKNIDGVRVLIKN